MTNEAIIEVSIPMRYLEDCQDEYTTQCVVDCPICAHAVCPDEACALALTTLTCCEQTLCCGCFGKLLQRCRCVDECRAVVGTCPFCREMCRADAVNIFLATKRPCRACRK